MDYIYKYKKYLRLNNANNIQFSGGGDNNEKDIMDFEKGLTLYGKVIDISKKLENIY